jgi:EPS-associated MarR family transcriptional regulator
MNKKLLITGETGFMDSAVIRHIINKTGHSAINFEKLAYAGNLESLERDSCRTHRKLTNDLGVSLGKINYCIKNLVKKGFIKVDNFRNSSKKIQYSYLRTTKGIEEKAKLTLDFIRIKTHEYDTLIQEAKNMDRNLL